MLSHRGMMSVVMLLVALGTLLACTSSGEESPPVDSSDWAPVPQQRNGLSTIASVTVESATPTLSLHTVDGERTFWGGVNLGATVPGHSPGEVAIPPERYREWIAQMGEVGVRFLRVYTIMRPSFYEALLQYNQSNPQQPIYLIHGVYLPDETYVDTQDLWRPGPTKAFEAEIRDASAAVRGTLKRPDTPGRADGEFTADVSPWLAAWIIGVEWDPVATHASDRKNRGRPDHAGKYFRSRDGTPTEVWIAQHMDQLAKLEAAQGKSMPIAFVNWPTTDPLKHPTEPLPQEDLVGVDANRVLPTKAWPGGSFASFHAYPYYPDFLRHETEYQNYEIDGQPDPYAGYLVDLRDHHAKKGLPLMITEFGVPSSIGSAHLGTLGRDQGQHSEEEAISTDAAMLTTFKSLGLSGGLLFAWADEWFKFTWNTVPRHSVVDSERRALWHDPLTNEQWFGLVAMDPQRVGWRTIHESQGPVQSVAVDHDASFVYLRVTFAEPPTSPFSVDFDSFSEGGEPSFGVTVDPQAGTAFAVVREDVDPIQLDGLDPAVLPAADLPGWRIQRMTVNRPFTVKGKDLPAEFVDVGRLVRGNWDPNSPDYNSMATWQLDDNELTLRLPWSMLGVADPSSRTGVRPGQNGIPEAVAIDEIPIAVNLGTGAQSVGTLRWEEWNKADYQPRLKNGWQQFRDALVATAE